MVILFIDNIKFILGTSLLICNISFGFDFKTINISYTKLLIFTNFTKNHIINIYLYKSL